MKFPPRPGDARGGSPGGRLRPRSTPPDKGGKKHPVAVEPGKGPHRPSAGPRGPLPRAPRPAFPELLAPAGSAEAYYAAVDAGADAVYLGLGKFNARERAENFNLADLCRIRSHARARGVRLYVAMNTLLTEADLPEAIGLLHQVAPLSPDAIIAADFGLVRILRDFFPGIPIHMSTQAGCASAEAAEEFARMGASRVILERHLRKEEIARIAERSPVGVEIFVHGSMCFSYSGKCLFSSYLGGKSGNRGVCVQPCRRLYAHGGEPEAIFSTRDLSLLPHLPDLVPLGITALKIEGRMRGAEYVAGVVSAYRVALDAIRAGNPVEGVAEGTRLLLQVIGRETTSGLPGGARPDEVATGGESGNVGDLIGAVGRVEDGWAFVPGAAGLSPGERLRVQFREDGSGRGFSATDLRSGEGGLRVKVPFPVSPGDLLFRVGGTGRAEFTRLARKEMEATPQDGARFLVSVSPGTVTIKASYGNVEKAFVYRISGPPGGPSGTVPPDGERQLAEAYRGDLPLAGVRVEIHGGPGVWGDVRTLFLQAARQFDREFYLAGKRLRVEILPTLRVSGSRPEEGPGTVIFAACRPEQLPHLPRTPEIVPVVEFTRSLARDPSPAARYARSGGGFLRLPTPMLEADAAFLRRTVTEAIRKGFTRWLVSDAGHFRLFAPAPLRRQVTLISDHYLYAFNTAALASLSRMGATRMILPAEATIPVLRDVGKFLYGLGIAVAYGQVPLMISRLLPASGVRGGTVESQRAERFHVMTDEHGSAVLPAEPFSASGSLHVLREAGIRDFFADLRGLGPAEIADVLSALSADRVIPGTSTFNLFRRNF